MPVVPMEDAEPGKVTVTLSDGEETYVWQYPSGQSSEMRDVIVEQVEEGRLHPYIGVMALHAVSRCDEL